MSYVCELMFERQDCETPSLSYKEVDYYARSTPRVGIGSHRLSLRKKQASGEYEVYRRFMERRGYALAGGGQLVSGVTHEDTGLERVVYTGTFEGALRFASREMLSFYGGDPGDKPCRHRPGEWSFLCPKRGER